MKTPFSKFGLSLICLLLSFFVVTVIRGANPIVNQLQPPTVNITAPTNNTLVALGSSLALSANATSPDTLVMEVDYYDGNGFVGWSTSPPYSIADQITVSGTHSFTAIATDYYGLTGVSGSIQVITANPPSVQITSPQQNSLVLTGSNVSLSATATASGGTITGISYCDNGGLIGSGTGTNYGLLYNVLTSGTHILSATATDNRTFTGTSQTVTLTAVSILGVLITSPSNGGYAGIGGDIILTSTAVTASGSIAEVAYYETGNPVPVGLETAPPYSFSWFISGTGTYSFYAVATNSGGQTATSPTVVVNALLPPVITLTSPTQNSLVLAGTTLAISADASAAGRDISQVTFYDNSNRMGSVTSWPYLLTGTISASGTHWLTAVATDNHGISVTSQPVLVTAVDGLGGVITSPPNNTYIEAGDSIILTGSAIGSSGTITSGTTATCGTISSVAYLMDGTTSSGSSGIAPYTVSYQVLSTGTHSFTAVVSGTGVSSGSLAITSATSNAITVRVLSAGSAYADSDRDGYPNIFEDAHGSDPDSAASVPTPDFIVDPSHAYGSYNTIQSAINAVTQDYQIISVLSGTYNENIAISSTGYKIMLISTGSASTVICGTGGAPVVTLDNSSVLNGFTITGGSSAATGVAGGVQIQQGSPRLTNCVIAGNQAPSGAAIYSSGSNPTLLNCTVTANTAGAPIVVASGSMTIINSIVWDPAEQTELSGSTFAVSYSDVGGNGVYSGSNNLNANPFVGCDGHILSISSPCIGQALAAGTTSLTGTANILLAPLADMDGEMRSGTAPDIGADEFICTGTVGLPVTSATGVALTGTTGLANWWVIRYFGGVEPDPNALAPAGNGLTNLQAFQEGLNPLDPFNGESACVTIVSGDSQVGAPGQPVAQPLIVHVTNAQGIPFVQAPISFQISDLDAAISGTNSPGVTGSDNLVVFSDSNGNAAVCLMCPVTPDATSTVAVAGVTAQTQTAFASISSVSQVGSWALDGSAGSVVASDSSAIENNGDIVGAPQWTTGCDGNPAVLLDGSTQYVQIADNPAYHFGQNAFSITAWVELRQDAALTGSNVYPILFKGASESAQISFALRGGTDNGLCMELSDSFGDVSSLAAGSDQSGRLTDYHWHHVAFVRDSQGNGMLYLDGTLAASGTGIDIDADSTQPLWIGRDANGGFFNGAIARVQIYYADALSSDEIAQMYNQDSKGGGIPDWWETLYGLNPQNSSVPGDLAANGDGLTNLEEYQMGLSPTNSAYSGGVSTVTTTGSNQNGTPGLTFAAPLTVTITGSNGQPLNNAPVIFTCSGTNGNTLGVGNGPGSPVESSTNRLVLLTGSDGQVSTYFAVNSSGSNVQINAVAGPKEVTFNETLLPIVGQWNFVEGTGTSTADSSNTGNTGTLCGGATWASGTAGYAGCYAICLDGSSGYVAMPDYGVLGANSISLTAWIQVPANLTLTTPGYTYPIAAIGDSYSDALWIGLCGAEIDVTGNSLGQSLAFPIGAVVTDGGWHHIGVVIANMPSGTPTVTVVVDGKTAGSQQVGNSSALYGSRLWLGTDSSWDFFSGNLDNIELWNEALQESDIAAIYNIGSTNSQPPNWWTWKYYGNLSVSGTALAQNCNGLTNEEAYEQGLNPLTGTPDGRQGCTLAIVSGTNQSGFPGSFLPQALCVKVTGTDGITPLANEPVTFSVSLGSGLLAAGNTSSSLSPVLSATTGTDGSALAYYQLGASDTNCQILVTAGTSSVVFSASVSAVTQVGLWYLDDAAGTVLSDSSGLSNTATLTGSADQVTGYDGSGALALDGSSGYISLPSNASLNFGNGAFSFFAWICLPPTLALSDSSNQYVIFSSQSSAEGQLQFEVAGGSYNGLYALLTDPFGTPWEIYSGTNLVQNLADGNWHQVGLVRDNQMNCTLYLDGTSVAQATTGPVAVTGDAALQVGMGPAGSGFVGDIDKIEIFRTAQNPNDYNISTNGSGLPDWWQFQNFGCINLSGTAVDSKGLTNLQEYQLGIDPNNPDSDGDGIPDGWAVAHGLNPLGQVAANDYYYVTGTTLGADSGYSNLAVYLSNTNSQSNSDVWLPSKAAPKIIIVDINGTGDYTSIQTAINHQTSEYQEILVLPGTYNENITLPAAKHFYLLSQVEGGAIIAPPANQPGPALSGGIGGLAQGFWIVDAEGGVGTDVEVGQDITFLNCYFANDSSGYATDILNNGGNVTILNSQFLSPNPNSVQQTAGTFSIQPQ